MTSNSHKSQDPAREVFARVFVRCMEFEPDAKFSTFLGGRGVESLVRGMHRRQRHSLIQT